MSDKKVAVGKFGRPHGVKGWIRVISFTDPEEQLLNYSDWMIQTNIALELIKLEESRAVHDAFLVKVKGYDDRDLVKTLTNKEILIDRDQLKELPEGEFYWTDLEGIKVVTTDGNDLGVIDHLFETGANDVIVSVKDGKRILIPYIDTVIIEVDFDNNIMTVNWETE